MAKGIADHIDDLIRARIRPLEYEVKVLKKRVDIQAKTLEELDSDVAEIHERLHEGEDRL